MICQDYFTHTHTQVTSLSLSSMTDGPSFRVPPSDQYAELGDNVTLRCQVDSMPDPTIVWINQRSQTVEGKGPELHIKVTKDTVGAYLCIAKVEGFPEISGTVGVFLKVRYMLLLFLSISKT